MSRWGYVSSFLYRVYLLRVPLLTAVGIVGFCFAAFVWPPGAGLLLGNAFDIGSFWGIFSVSLTAPAATVLNVRGAGQRIHNDVQIDLLIDKWSQMDEQSVTITRAVFEYDQANTPLSWHLTEDDRLAIERNWRRELNRPENWCVGWEKVKTFLTPQKEERG
jgi:hypothetical protein